MLKRSIASCVEASWSSISLAPRRATLRIESGLPAAIQIGGCGFCRVGGSTMMFSKFQNLPWCENRSLRGPGLDDQLEPFLEARVGLLDRNAEARELVVAIALADAEFEPAAGEQIDGGGLLGEQHRIVPREHDDGGAEAERLGARRDPGQQVQRGRDLAEAGEMMLDHEGRVIAQRLGLDVVFDVVLEALTAVEVGAAALRLRAAEQSEFHPWPSLNWASALLGCGAI